MQVAVARGPVRTEDGDIGGPTQGGRPPRCYAHSPHRIGRLIAGARDAERALRVHRLPPHALSRHVSPPVPVP